MQVVAESSPEDRTFLFLFLVRFLNLFLVHCDFMLAAVREGLLGECQCDPEPLISQCSVRRQSRKTAY